MSFSRLLAAAGRWRGTNQLVDPHNSIDDRSAARATVSRVLGDRFLRIDYSWAFQKKPQQGSMLVAHDPKANTDAIHWIDTWHNGNRVMVLAAPSSAERLSVRGSYPAPPGPDWGWRIALSLEGRALRVVMHNIIPPGFIPGTTAETEVLAVDATFSRTGGAANRAPKKKATRKAARPRRAAGRATRRVP